MQLHNLKKIGLTEGEIKVYGALLKIGESTKTLLAKEARIAPSNIYDITNRLIEKGIISKIEKNGIAHFKAANPNRLLDFVKQKESEIKKEEEIIHSLLPELISNYQNNNEKVNVEVFTGWNGLKTVFEDLLDDCKKGDENYIFGANIGKNEERADEFFLKYSTARAKKGIITKIIFNEGVKNRKERINFFMKNKNYEIRFLKQSTPSEIMIYKEVVSIIILNEQPLVIRIKSKEAADSFVQYFDNLWKIAEK